METVGAYEAKTHLSRLLERVSNGEQFTITKHGVPVAMLVPVNNSRKEEILKAIQGLEELSKGCTLGGLKIKDMIEEGRRF